MKHTPGPWNYGIASECIITPQGHEIASLADSDSTEKETNARLIAAAPVARKNRHRQAIRRYLRLAL